MRAAVRTDFVLSAEIIVITLGTVAGRPLATQIGVMVGIAALMTVGVYGLVAGIVRLDDIGLYLSRFPDGARRRLGRAILAGAPYLMRTLSVVGTAAMFLVGGGILTHGLPGAHEFIGDLTRPGRRCTPARADRRPGRQRACRSPRRRGGVRGAARGARRAECVWTQPSPSRAVSSSRR